MNNEKQIIKNWNFFARRLRLLKFTPQKYNGLDIAELFNEKDSVKKYKKLVKFCVLC